MIGILLFVLNDAVDSRWSELRLFAEGFGDGGGACILVVVRQWVLAET
jgi:hypothetical protein